jgi:hypothetical protein
MNWKLLFSPVTRDMLGNYFVVVDVCWTSMLRGVDEQGGILRVARIYVSPTDWCC